MALDVFRAVALALMAFFEGRQNGCPIRLRALEVRVDVVDVHEDAVHDVRHLGPSARGLAFLAMLLRPVVVRRGRGHHHDASFPRVHLAVFEATFRSDPPVAFAKAESARQPVHRRGAVFVGDHRDHSRIVVHAASPGWYSPKTPRSTRQHSPMVTYPASAAFSGGMRFSVPRAARSSSARCFSTAAFDRRARSFFSARACANWCLGPIFMISTGFESVSVYLFTPTTTRSPDSMRRCMRYALSAMRRCVHPDSMHATAPPSSSISAMICSAS